MLIIRSASYIIILIQLRPPSNASQKRVQQRLPRRQPLCRIQRQRLLQQVHKVLKQLGVLVFHFEEDGGGGDEAGAEVAGGFGDDDGLDHILRRIIPTCHSQQVLPSDMMLEEQLT